MKKIYANKQYDFLVLKTKLECYLKNVASFYPRLTNSNEAESNVKKLQKKSPMLL